MNEEIDELDADNGQGDSEKTTTTFSQEYSRSNDHRQTRHPKR